MPDRSPILRSLLEATPDLPKWVEVRSLLLAGECEIYGYEERPEPACVVRDSRLNLMAVIGAPSPAAILEATSRDAGKGEILVQREMRRYVAGVLPEWKHEAALLHLPGKELRLPDIRDGAVRILGREEIGSLREVSADLRRELRVAAAFTTVAAALHAGRPVSFCCAGAVTESLWDVAIDTLEPYRRRGMASRCAAFMIRRMEALGRTPVWGAVESNVASLGLAASLGFVPADRLSVFSLSKGQSSSIEKGREYARSSRR